MSDLQKVVLGAIQAGALPTAIANNMPNLLPVDEGSLGDLPWFFQSGVNFNALTYNWLNNLFAFSSDGYVGTNGATLTTEYFNVLQAIAFELDPAANEAYNTANLNAAATISTLFTNWLTILGPLPPGTQDFQLQYITTQVLSWGVPDLTLGIFRNSANPGGLLPNTPIGAEPIVQALFSYLGATSSVANIQTALLSFNNQLVATRNNVVPPTPLTVVKPGFMQTINQLGQTQIVPEITIGESIGNLQNGLDPSSGGTSFSEGYTATLTDSSTVQVTSSRGAVGLGALGFLLAFRSGGTSTNIFSFDSSLTSCTINLTFNGVTPFTPAFTSYDVSTGTGWWNPTPIQSAVNASPDASGYVFNVVPPPSFNFDVNGNFGVISGLLISQQPVISLTYATSNLSAITSTFSQGSLWGVSFLGFGLGGGSSTYYQATAVQNSGAGTVTLTMDPVGLQTPVTPTAQLAYVIGADILWPGASTLQNQAGVE
jgi:hypothetical protein